MMGSGSMIGYGLGGWGGSGVIGGLSMALMGIVPLLIVGLIVWLVVEATRHRDERSATYVVPGQYPGHPPVVASPGSTVTAARSLLDERYARGEIDREEYLRRREDLA